MKKITLAWDFVQLADRLRDIIQAAENDLRLEQAVYGLDAKDEVAIQSLLAEQLAAHYCVAREVHYPSTATKKISSRMRCDLVLCPLARPLKLESVTPTLFDPAEVTGPELALWLEVKIAYQFGEGGRRHTHYTSQWRNAVVDDLRKMEAEPLIRHAGLLLIVFNESKEVLEKDLELFEDVLARKEVLAGFRQVRSIPILDRLGHHLCTIALWPTIQR